MKLKICIIGNGVFANKVHYPCLASFSDVEIIGIFAFNEGRLRQTASQYQIPEERVYALSAKTDYRQVLLKLKPDAVYAIGQPEQLFDVWMWCLENRFPLFIEKPMGITWHQATMLAWLADQNQCITQVCFQRSCSPVLQKMKAECLKSGPITHAVVEFSKYETRPMFGTRDRMLDDFTHCIDTGRWICGGEIIKIESHCRRIAGPDINWIGASLYFDNGSVCYAIGNWNSGRRVFKATLHAPGICVEVETEKEACLYAEGDYDGVRYSSREIAGSDEFFIFAGFQRKHREFVDSVLSGIEKTSSPFRDALKTMKVCESILAQSILV